MPLTPGVKWVCEGNRFKKTLMADQMSLGQIQWLMYLQETDLCKDSQGKRIQLQHGYYQGEHIVKSPENDYKVDGYMMKDGIEYFFEYLG